MISVSLVTRSPKYANKPKISDKKCDVEEEINVKNDEYRNSIGFKEAFMSARFWHMLIMLFFGEFYCLYNASSYKLVAQNTISDRSLTIAGALGSILNGLSRVVWGALLDKYGFKKLYLMLLTIETIVSFSIESCKYNATLYIICVALSFLCIGGHISLFSATGVRIFGIRNGG